MARNRSADDDDSSVESEYQDGSMKDAVASFDDVSVVSFDKEIRGANLASNDSVESLFSTESSVEVSLAASTDAGSKHAPAGNANWSKGQRPKHKGRMITLVTMPQEDEQVPLNSGPSGSGGLRRDNPLSGSCNSIKDNLSFGSIDEHADYDSLPSSDEESSDEESVDGNEKKVVAKAIAAKPSSKYYFDDNSVSEESSVDDSVINSILRKTDSKEHIKVANKHTKQKPQKRHSRHGQTRKKGATSDPLLNQFIKNRQESARESEKTKGSTSNPSKSGSPTAKNNQGPRGAKKKVDDALDAIMSKTDSLNHVGLAGRRVVKTIKDERRSVKTARRSSLGSAEELLERFVKSHEGQRMERRSSIDSAPSQSDFDKIFTSTDSFHRVLFNQRRVGTRPAEHQTQTGMNDY